MDYQEQLRQAIEEAKKQPNLDAYSGDNAYNDMKKKAAIAQQYERQRLADRISNAGNAPLSIQNRDEMFNRNIQGAITNAGQNYTQYLNNMASQANANAETQSAGFTADFNAAENTANINNQMSEAERYYNLYMNGKMTSSQFKKKTGIDAKIYGAGKKKKPPEATLAETLNIGVNKGAITPEEAIEAYRQGNNYTTNSILDKIVNWEGN